MVTGAMSDTLPPLLAMERLAKVYPGGTVALRGVDLTIRPGTVHGLLGANGAGKSTLIRILCAAAQATSGNDKAPRHHRIPRILGDGHRLAGES